METKSAKVQQGPGHWHRLNLFEQFLYSVLTAPVSITKWMSKVLSKLSVDKPPPIECSDYEEFAVYFNDWLKSVDEPLCEFSDEIPEWLDLEKFHRGRKFATRHLLGLVYAEQLSVVLLLSVPMLRRPLIFSGKSDSDEKAFRRYLSTVERVLTWYTEDIWDKHSKAYHNLLVVRGMHSHVNNGMTTCTKSEREDKIELLNTGTSSPFLETLHADLEPYLQNTKDGNLYTKLESSKAPFINQSMISLTQIGFVGLLILQPEKFGASRASKEDLDDFVYVWYVLGHQLGLADRYNICAGGLEETQRRCQLILRHVVFPSLAVAGRDWEHMSRCVIAGVNRILRQNSFEASLYYSLWALSVPTPHIEKLITWRQLPRLWLFKYVLVVLHSFPGVPDLFGFLLSIHLRHLRRRVDRADSKAAVKLK